MSLACATTIRTTVMCGIVITCLGMNNELLIGSSKALVLSMIATPASAREINERLSIGGVLAGAIQCQNVSDAPGSSNTCDGLAPFQLELDLRPTEADEIFLTLAFFPPAMV